MRHLHLASLRRVPLWSQAAHCAFSILQLAAFLLAGHNAEAQAQAASSEAGADRTGVPAEHNQPTPGPTGSGDQPRATPSSGLWERSNLLGDIGGLRPFLDDYGISLGLTETSEVLGNPTGGRSRGVVYEGLTQMSLGVDLERAAGLSGGALNVSAYQIHGRGLTANHIGNLNTVSNIEATRATRLFELWYQQSFLAGKLDLRIGQQAADQEFLSSQYSSLFLNAPSFGWPGLPSVDLPSGGPIYPLATPGVRVRARPTDRLTLLAGVYNGDPAGPGAGDPQRRNASGTDFRIGDGVFAIVEGQYAVNQGENASGLPGTYKIGAWYNSQPFADQRFDESGIPLASPLSSGVARKHRNDYSFYAMADQLIYRRHGAQDGGAALFLRVMGAPGDRNLVDFFLDAGLTYKGLLPCRENDTIGVGIGYSRIGDAARKADADTRSFSGAFFPIRDNETVLEATYQYQAAPWWVLQPDAQYVFNPGGRILNPDKPGKRVGDAAVIGLRTNIVF